MAKPRFKLGRVKEREGQREEKSKDQGLKSGFVVYGLCGLGQHSSSCGLCFFIRKMGIAKATS